MNSSVHPQPAQRRSVYSNYRPAPETAEELFQKAPSAGASLSGEPSLTSANPDSLGSLQDSIDEAMARAFVYQFLARSYEYPEREAWQWLCDPAVHEVLCTAFSRAQAQAAPGSEAGDPGLSPLLEHFNEAAFEGFQSAYISAFGHSARGDCPINEVEYGDLKADPLFQPHRLADLGAFYAAFGLELCENASERLDHLCCELEFMGVLAAKEAYGLEQQFEEEQITLCREAQKKFIREHLGRWTPAFTRRLEAMACGNVLGALAQVTRVFVLAECERVGVSPGSADLLLRPVDEAAERACASCGVGAPPPGG
jgi:putative dimethyl sulfoxide reductase chaperone